MTEPLHHLSTQCDDCGQTDDHPKHIVIYSFADDSQNKVLHHDCGNAEEKAAVAGLLEGAEGKKGEELRQHLLSLPAVDRNENAVQPVDGQGQSVHVQGA